MSRYGQFGLDEKKVSREKGANEKFLYDPWQLQEFPAKEPHVYLCFSNFALSGPTIQVFQQHPPVDSKPGDACFKCKQFTPTLHYDVPGATPIYEGGTNSLGICPACIEWAADYLTRRSSPPPQDLPVQQSTSSFMQFIVSSGILLKNLTKIAGVVQASPVLPILDHFLFSIEENTLTVTASDLSTTMLATIPVEAKGDVRVCVPAKLMLEALDSITEQPLTVHVKVNAENDTYLIELITDNGEFGLAGRDPIDFPKVGSIKKNHSLSLVSDALLSAIGYTLFATLADDQRPALGGMLLELSKGKATFVTSDAHRIVRYERTDVQADSELSLVLPHKALTLLAKAMPKGEQVLAELNDTNASFSFANLKLVCRLIDEGFPNYSGAMNGHNPNVLEIGRTDLLKTLKRTLIFANRSTHQILLSLSANRITITTEDVDHANKAKETLFCAYAGDPMNIAFSGKKLQEILTTLDAKMVSLELAGPANCAYLVPMQQPEGEDMKVMLSVARAN